jgi:hypothetical protein
VSSFVAFGLVGAFCLFQILPLFLAFKGKAGFWLLAQVGFGLSLLALASIQNDGRGAWVLLAATGAALTATAILSLLLALFGHHLRQRKAHQIQKGNAECPSS